MKLVNLFLSTLSFVKGKVLILSDLMYDFRFNILIQDKIKLPPHKRQNLRPPLIRRTTLEEGALECTFISVLTCSFFLSKDLF
ncbi:unnamed protein product [Oikopleura dioica]|uniref:Uncharacterized protein n=1 Tax=Oikopleura dioica TaxID=34765 RepID=E4WVT2_OIKDI|nr:unnamed protein product [Oikopleura dioica]